MIDYSHILTKRYSGKLWTLEGETYEGLTWLDKGKKPTQTELDALWPEVQQQIKDEEIAKVDAKKVLLQKLGLTAAELKLLIG